MAMNDLLKSFQMFGDAMLQLGQHKATNDAQQQLQQINAQYQDENQRQQAAMQVGNQLALRLTGLGADASQIAAATQGFLPSAGTQATNKAQSEMQQASFGQQEKMAGIEHGYKMEELGLRAGKEKAATEMKWNKYQTEQVQKFLKRYDGDIQGLKQMSTYRDIIANTPIGNIGVELAKRGLIKLSGDSRPSDKDLASFDTDPAVMQKLTDQWDLKTRGTNSAAKRQRWVELLDKIQGKVQQNLDSAIKGNVDSLSSIHQDLDAGTYEKALRSEIPQLGGQPSDSKNRFMYSPSKDTTYEVDASGNVVKTYPGKTRGQ